MPYITSNPVIRKVYKYILFGVFPIALSCHGQDSGEDAYEPDTLFAVRNAVKFDPPQIIFGDFRLYYERILSERWSAEVGLGITRRNYGAGWFDYDLDNLGAHVDIRTGPSLGVVFRRYFREGPELNGPYLAAGYAYREYIKGYRPLDHAGELTGQSLTDRRKFSSIVLLLGVQPLSYSGNVFADFYTGPAIRFTQQRQVRAPDDLHPDLHHVHRINRVNLGWEIGVRVGFGF